MIEPAKRGLWRRHPRTMILAAVPAWVVLIVLMYTATRPGGSSGTSVNVLKIGALPVT